MPPHDSGSGCVVVVPATATSTAPTALIIRRPTLAAWVCAAHHTELHTWHQYIRTCATTLSGGGKGSLPVTQCYTHTHTRTHTPWCKAASGGDHRSNAARPKVHQPCLYLRQIGAQLIPNALQLHDNGNEVCSSYGLEAGLLVNAAPHHIPRLQLRLRLRRLWQHSRLRMLCLLSAIVAIIIWLWLALCLLSHQGSGSSGIPWSVSVCRCSCCS